MADEKKPATKKADAAKAAGEKAEAKKAAKKASTSKAEKKATEKKPAAKKEAKKARSKKSGETKKASSDKKPSRAEAKKAPAKQAPAAPPVIRASARYVRIAPRKARLVADQVRGLHIEKARALLQFSPRGAAQDIQKLINSAASNAENNHDLIGDEMRVASITVDEGPTLRRFRPRAMGRATPINKRTSHIAVALTPVED
jgi:ribosomal protein L22